MSIQQDAQNMIEYIGRLQSAGAAMAQGFANPTKNLPAQAGIFAKQLREWKAEESYTSGEAVQWKGVAYQVQQSVTNALATQAPDAEGLLALYTPYPAPDRRGYFPYVKGMHVEVGMIEYMKDGSLWEAIQGMPTQLYPPNELPAIFTRI